MTHGRPAYTRTARSLRYCMQFSFHLNVRGLAGRRPLGLRLTRANSSSRKWRMTWRSASSGNFLSESDFEFHILVRSQKQISLVQTNQPCHTNSDAEMMLELLILFPPVIQWLIVGTQKHQANVDYCCVCRSAQTALDPSMQASAD